jgi:hypothetical protein
MGVGHGCYRTNFHESIINYDVNKDKRVKPAVRIRQRYRKELRELRPWKLYSFIGTAEARWSFPLVYRLQTETEEQLLKTNDVMLLYKTKRITMISWTVMQIQQTTLRRRKLDTIQRFVILRHCLQTQTPINGDPEKNFKRYKTKTLCETE